MNFLVFFIVGLSLALAKPLDNQHVSVSQDTAGNYKFTVNTIGHNRVEQGNADGTVSGSYSYIDANGVLQMVQYTAGSDGFRATGNHFPVAPIIDVQNAAILQQVLPTVF